MNTTKPQGSKLGKAMSVLKAKYARTKFTPRTFRAKRSLDDFLVEGEIMIEVSPNIIRPKDAPDSRIGLDLRLFEERGGLGKWFEEINQCPAVAGN